MVTAAQIVSSGIHLPVQPFFHFIGHGTLAGSVLAKESNNYTLPAAKRFFGKVLFRNVLVVVLSEPYGQIVPGAV